MCQILCLFRVQNKQYTLLEEVTVAVGKRHEELTAMCVRVDTVRERKLSGKMQRSGIRGGPSKML